MTLNPPPLRRGFYCENLMQKRCTICGAVFQAPPSSKKITCCARCSSIRKALAHTGKPHAWGPEAKARLSAKGRTANLHLGMPAARRSPIAGPFETNQEAKIWTVVSPSGRTYTVRNLTKFFRDNPDLIPGNTPSQAAHGIYEIHKTMRGKRVRSRGVWQWKGWRLLDVRTPD